MTEITNYTTGINGIIFALLRSALTGEKFELSPSETEWAEAYQMADMQSVLGICFEGVKRLDRSQLPPFEVFMQWAGDAETLLGLNKQLNAEAARLTGLFAAEGRKTAILKGQANARLYPKAIPPARRHRHLGGGGAVRASSPCSRRWD